MAEKSYDDMTPEERVEAVRQLMAAGHSNVTAARALGVEPGVVSGIRWRKHIPSTHKPGFEVGFTTRAKSSSGYVVRVAKSEETRCKAKVHGMLCRYERDPGSEYCARPEHQALEKRRA